MPLMYMFAHVINLTIYLLPPPHPEAKPRGILLINIILLLRSNKTHEITFDFLRNDYLIYYLIIKFTATQPMKIK